MATFSQILNGKIIKLNNSSSFKILRHFHLMVFSPLSLTYIHAMTRTAIQGNQIKTRIMDIEKLDYEDEKDLYDDLAMLQTQLKVENKHINLSVHCNVFYRDNKDNKYLKPWKPNCVSDDQNIAETDHSVVDQWIDHQSRGKITGHNLDACTSFLMGNCVYFFGEWELDLTKNSKPVYKANLRNFSCLECRFIELKYKGDRFSMILIYPFNFEAYLRIFNHLDSGVFNLIIGRLAPSNAQFILPKGMFQLSIRFDHIMSLENLDYIYGTDIVNQKLFLNITETCTEVAAVTTCNPSDTDLVTYAVRHDMAPMIFVIYDKVLKVNLFMGQAYSNEDVYKSY